MEVSLNSRVIDAEGYRATVRYIGPVAAAKNKTEVWLGVEWDDKSRGKHDGSCVDAEGNLHRYFICSNGAGSFVKQGKVSAGKSFVDALQERYVALDAPEIVGPDQALPGAFVTTAKGHQKQIEFVGEKNIRKWQQLSTINKVAIRNDAVSITGENAAELAGHLVEVDLQDNLLWQWSEVCKLSSQLPLLTSLLLQGNKFQPLSAELVSSLPNGSLNNIQILALNGCNITSWASVQLLEPMLPSLRELYLSDNNLSDLYCDDDEKARVAATNEVISSEVQNLSRQVRGFNELTVLDLANCQLQEWSQVAAFAHLPMLQQIVLDGNPIPRIEPVGVTDFMKLYRISISSTRLSSWDHVNALSTFPSLVNVRLSHIPLFNGKGASELRPLVIGRLAKLQVFNASLVTPRERRDSERTYLRQIIRQLGESNASKNNTVSSSSSSSSHVMPPAPPLQSSANTQSAEDSKVGDLLNQHPRYLELQQLYGADIVVGKAGKEMESGVLASELLNITLHYVNFRSASTSNEPIVRRLPASLTVSKLQTVVRQLFGLEPHLQLISLRLVGDVIPTVLDDDQATLSYYGAQDGTEIFVNEKD